MKKFSIILLGLIMTQSILAPKKPVIASNPNIVVTPYYFTNYPTQQFNQSSYTLNPNYRYKVNKDSRGNYININATAQKSNSKKYYNPKLQYSQKGIQYIVQLEGSTVTPLWFTNPNAIYMGTTPNLQYAPSTIPMPGSPGSQFSVYLVKQN